MINFHSILLWYKSQLKFFIFIGYQPFKMDSDIDTWFKDETLSFIKYTGCNKKSASYQKCLWTSFTEIQVAKYAVPKTNRQMLVFRKYDMLACGDKNVIKEIRRLMRWNTLCLCSKLNAINRFDLNHSCYFCVYTSYIAHSFSKSIPT